MHPLLEAIYKTNQFTNSSGETVRIHSHTQKSQCEFIQSIIRNNNFKDTLEIGFAYGISTLAIIEEVSKINGRHCVIDKFQISGWGGNGLDLIRQAGYIDNLDFFEEYCYKVLPQLMFLNKKIDLAYIDSTKQFDWLLLNFFYIDKLLKIGGIVVFDDVDWPGIRKLLRYISRFPNYRLYGVYPENKRISLSKKLRLTIKFFPKVKNLLKSNVVKTDYELGINAHCVALQKIDEDKRNWDWHVDF